MSEVRLQVGYILPAVEKCCKKKALSAAQPFFTAEFAEYAETFSILLLENLVFVFLLFLSSSALSAVSFDYAQDGVCG